jgi:ribonucleotide reductase beta subunit family protein with ferritin-like domain
MQYIEFGTTTCWCRGLPRFTTNPFDFMGDDFGAGAKTNFFEKRVAGYRRPA